MRTNTILMSSAARQAVCGLHSVTFFVRNLERSARFFSEGLGLTIASTTSSHIHLQGQNSPTVELHQSPSEAHCSTGFSPMITFTVDDMDSRVPRMIELGATLDGAVQYRTYGKVRRRLRMRAGVLCAANEWVAYAWGRWRR